MSELFAHRCERGSLRGRGGLGVLAGIFVVLFLAGARGLAAGEPSGTIVLGETVARGASSQVRIELKAQGLFRPGTEPSKLKDGAKMPKPLSIEIETRLVFYERVLDVVDDAMAIRTGKEVGPGNPGRGRPRKVVRHVIQAAAAINGEIRPRATSLRPEVAVLVAERRRGDGPVVVVSPAGPLTRSELELVEVAGDPLALTDLLPTGPVRVGAVVAGGPGRRGGDQRLRHDREPTRWRPRSSRSTRRRPGCGSTAGSRARCKGRRA